MWYQWKEKPFSMQQGLTIKTIDNFLRDFLYETCVGPKIFAISMFLALNLNKWFFGSVKDNCYKSITFVEF